MYLRYLPVKLRLVGEALVHDRDEDEVADEVGAREVDARRRVVEEGALPEERLLLQPQEHLCSGRLCSFFGFTCTGDRLMHAVFTCAMLISLMISTRVSPIFSRAEWARSASTESFLSLLLLGVVIFIYS